MPAPPIVADLVERYRQNADVYESGHYKEAELRQEFIEPFFKALGWDVGNEQGIAESLKYVVHEESLAVGGATKAPDYTFRIGGTRMFFLEAKNPSIPIGEAGEPAYQLRRYAWSAKVRLGILTNFREFAVYDRRVMPRRTDKPSVARTWFLTLDDYLTRWDEIAAVLSCEAVWKGSLDRYVKSKELKGTTEVDDAFLAEIEGWRDVLARNLAIRNPGLAQGELNFAVQATIDRTVFLRICEDRGLEPYGRLQALLNGEGVYRRLFELFERADGQYNSGLFHFQRESERPEAPDTLTPNLSVDDRILKDILRRLYYPESPYEFSVLPADILGQVYERFLGKVIRLTAGHRAVVEEKPEVRKAGGVYYTPTPIVDYIVKQTVGRLLAGKTPRQAARLRILDPACGSGSFLLGAYQHLLDWHLDWYRAHDPEKHSRGNRPAVCAAPGGDWRLTASERKRILLSDLYGVDIDAQAVEVTKLSLLLKVLEGQSGELLQRQFERFRERALPDLAGNIKCGNSLVGRDVYNNHQMGLFDREEILRVNPFEWRDEFPEIMAAGGFDAVIGNPPYVRIQTLSEFRPPAEMAYYKRHYRAAGHGNYDVYALFAERGLRLLNPSGRLGVIIPNKFLTTDSGGELRNVLAEAGVDDGIVDFGHEQVFGQSTTYTCLLFLDRAQPKTFFHIQTQPDRLGSLPESPRRTPTRTLGPEPWILVGRASSRLLGKLKKRSVPLLRLPTEISRGVSTGADEVFCLRTREGELTNRAGDRLDLERAILKRTLCATDFTRYRFRPGPEQYVIFPYHVGEQGYELLGESVLRAHYPKTYDYLRSHKKLLSQRKQSPQWYGFSAPRNLNLHARADLLVPLLADRGLCAPTPRDLPHWCIMASAGFSVRLPRTGLHTDPLYVLGLVNSKLLFWNLRQISNKFRGGWVTCTKQFFGTLPIRTINEDDPTDRARAEKMIRLVDRVLEVCRDLGAARTPHDQAALQRQIDATDGQIDQLVYELYGLTDEEIRLVEGG